MKYNYFIVWLFFATTLLKAENRIVEPTSGKDEKYSLTFMQQVKQEEKESLQRILATFTVMLTNFFNIAKAPNDPAVLAPNLSAMANGLISIAMEIFKKKIEIDDELEQIPLEIGKDELHMIDQIKKLLIAYGAELETIALELPQ